MTLKEYLKARLISSLSEDLTSPELADHLEGQYKYDKAESLARSPWLYVLDPVTGKPKKIPEAKLHPRLAMALSNTAHHGSGLEPEEVKMIQDFVDKHGHFVGGPRDGDFDIFQTDKRVLGNIFKK